MTTKKKRRPGRPKGAVFTVRRHVAFDPALEKRILAFAKASQLDFSRAVRELCTKALDF